MASGSTDLLGNYSQLSGCLTDEALSRAGQNGEGNWGEGIDGRQARHVGVAAWRALVQCNELESCLISVALGIKLARGAGKAKVATQPASPVQTPSYLVALPRYLALLAVHTRTLTDLLKPLSASIICMG